MVSRNRIHEGPDNSDSGAVILGIEQGTWRAAYVRPRWSTAPSKGLDHWILQPCRLHATMSAVPTRETSRTPPLTASQMRIHQPCIRMHVHSSMWSTLLDSPHVLSIMAGFPGDDDDGDVDDGDDDDGDDDDDDDGDGDANDDDDDDDYK